MRKTIAAAAAALTIGSLFAAQAQAGVTVVAPPVLGAWHGSLFDTLGTELQARDGGVTFVAGPAGQLAGVGSARLVTAGGFGDGSAQLYSTAFAGIPLSAIRTLSYATYATQATGPQLPYLRLTLDLDGNGSPDDQIIFEPIYQRGAAPRLPSQPAIAIGSWQVWNARAGGWWATNGLAGSAPGASVKTLDEISAAAPQARIVNTSSRNGGISLSSGVVAPDARFDANVDSFTIDSGNGPTTYDFEPGAGPARTGVSAIVQALEGTVTVTLPGRRARRVRARGQNVPVGTLVDASRGKAAITMAVSKRSTQTAAFHGGAFRIRQRRGFRPFTEITLRVPRFAALCGRGAAQARASGGLVAQSAQTRRRRSKKRVLSRLWGDGKGKFRTKGHNSAAIISGTRWLTQERCDGTLTFVQRGVVRVKDLRTGRTVTVRAGHSYLARRP